MTVQHHIGLKFAEPVVAKKAKFLRPYVSQSTTVCGNIGLCGREKQRESRKTHYLRESGGSR